MAELVLCNRCAWQGPKPESEFDISTRGINKGKRLKVCRVCKATHKTYEEKSKCPHGKIERYCIECTGITCECGVKVCQYYIETHKLTQKHITAMDPSKIKKKEKRGSKNKKHIQCEHGNVKEHCRRCGAGAICIHDKLRVKCVGCMFQTYLKAGEPIPVEEIKKTTDYRCCTCSTTQSGIIKCELCE